MTGNFFRERAHFAHVLLAGDCVNHAAGCQEEQAFEECVRHQMENSGGEGAHAAGQEHVAELRYRGVGQNFLDVVLHHAHGRSEKRGDCAD